jgi:hypothetical protein
MHYMPWYETPSVRGQWGSHWKGHQSQHKPDSIGADGQPDIYSHYHPLIGLYDSTDPAAIECHLLQMKLAGIDGVIVDWYGISGTADYPRMHDASRALFDAAGRSGMKFAACFEDRSLELMVNMDKFPSDQVPEQLARTVQWMGTEWFAKPQYFRLGGRPLLLNFGPMYVKDPAVWKAALDSVPDRPAFYHSSVERFGSNQQSASCVTRLSPWLITARPPKTTTRRVDARKRISSAAVGVVSIRSWFP